MCIHSPLLFPFASKKGRRYRTWAMYVCVYPQLSLAMYTHMLDKLVSSKSVANQHTVGGGGGGGAVVILHKYCLKWEMLCNSISHCWSHFLILRYTSSWIKEQCHSVLYVCEREHSECVINACCWMCVYIYIYKIWNTCTMKCWIKFACFNFVLCVLAQLQLLLCVCVFWGE